MAKNTLRLQYNFADLMKFIVIFSLVLALFAWSGLGLAPLDSWRETILMPVATALVVALSLMRRNSARASRCITCGRAFSPFPNANPPDTCPRCRVARLPVPAQRRVARNGFIIIAALILMLAGTIVWPFSGMIVDHVGGPDWVVLPILTLGLALILFALVVTQIVAGQLIQMYRISRPGRALALARICAGDEGESDHVGLTTAWGFGAKAPLSLLINEMTVATERFESLAGEPIAGLRPLDIFVFAKRDALEQFLKRSVLVAGADHDGMYIPWSTLTVACTTDLPPLRLSGVDRTLRTLFAYYALGSYNKAAVPSWLQIGIANVVACGGDPDEEDRLNRKMIAALARSRSLGTSALFEPTPRAMAALVRNQKDRESFTRYVQFVSQAWSVVEYLCGAGSPPGYADRFRAFLRDIRARESVRITFERQFGFRYETLLADWEAWVLARGAGTYSLPTGRMQDVLVDRVLPVVRHPTVPLETRVRAIREMGRAGYVQGADELIALLRSDDLVPRDEVVWALESIAGRALGDDPAPWEQWWKSLRIPASELRPKDTGDDVPPLPQDSLEPGDILARG